MTGKKVLLGAKYSQIEPLGLLHLSTVSKQEGYETKIRLVRDHQFKSFDSYRKEFNPKIVGFSIYTGNHIQTFEYLDNLKKESPDTKIVLGGPHATYFPEESLKHADFVVLSEGFDGFRRILREEAEKGIVHLKKREEFPLSDRETFYSENLEHKKSPIKSIITKTGCPFSCTYCYNSSSLEEISSCLTTEQTKEMEKVVGKRGRLFPKSSRSVEDILSEVDLIRKCAPETKFIFFQDDIFGEDLEWVKEFNNKYKKIGLPFHAQMRFEYTNPGKRENREKLELIRDAGCTGLTLAIESANSALRKEVLNRNTPEELMFNSFSYLSSLGYKTRTEQMLGLPYGATKKPTPINLEADLELLELNVKLKKETGLPTMAWASIFAPYRKTIIGKYCLDHGFYFGGNDDVPDTFFERSVLRFPKKWTGQDLSAKDDARWLSKKDLKEYKDKMCLLRDLFNYFALVPRGDKLAKEFLVEKNRDYKTLSSMTRKHLYDRVLYDIRDS